MEYVASALWIGIEVSALYLVCRAYMPQKKGAGYTLCVFLLELCITYIYCNFIPSAMSDPYVRIVLSFAVSLSAVSLTFNGAWYTRTLIAALWLVCMGLVDTILLSAVSTVLGISVSDLTDKRWLYVAVCTVDKCAVLFAAWCVFYLKRGKGHSPSASRRLMLMVLFPVISLAMMCVIFDIYKDQEDLSINAIVFSVILGLANVANIYLMTSLDRTYRAEQQLVMLNQSMQLQSASYAALEKSYKSQRTATHEFKHQLRAIRALLEQDKVYEAMDYIDGLQISQTSRMFISNTGNPIIDAVLNDKYHTAKDKNINFHLKVNDLSAVKAETDALVVLLSNLLDNAIEACERVDTEREINCSFLVKNDSFFILIKNTSLPVIINEDRIETVKQPSFEHGFGLPSIKRVLTQLDGDFAMEYSDGWFCFTAEIPLN